MLEGREVILSDGNGTTKTMADGSMTGNINGKPLSGEWTWEKGLFCREGNYGTQKVEPDCQKLEIAGDKLRVTQQNGNGPIVVLDLK